MNNNKNIKQIAKDLHGNLKLYQKEREATSQNDNVHTAKELAEELNRRFHETSKTFTQQDVFENVIYAKAKVLADLGILREVFLEVEILDEINKTFCVRTLECLTEGLI